MLAVRILPNELPQSRFGFAVGKRVGGAVVRNRVKRRLRAAIGALRPAGGWDVVVIARPSAAAADLAALRGALRSLARRAGVPMTAATGAIAGDGGAGRPSTPRTGRIVTTGRMLDRGDAATQIDDARVTSSGDGRGRTPDDGETTMPIDTTEGEA